MLELYDSGGRRLRSDDDSGWERWASRISEWRAPYGDTFFVLARQYNPRQSGAGTGYTIRIRAVGGGDGGPSPPPGDRIWVDRGCGSTYSVGDFIRVYMQVSSYGYYRLNANTDWGTRTSWGHSMMMVHHRMAMSIRRRSRSCQRLRLSTLRSWSGRPIEAIMSSAEARGFS